MRLPAGKPLFTRIDSIPCPHLRPEAGAVYQPPPGSLPGRDAYFRSWFSRSALRPCPRKRRSCIRPCSPSHCGSRDPRHEYSVSSVVPIFSVPPIRPGSSLGQPLRRCPNPAAERRPTGLPTLHSSSAPALRWVRQPPGRKLPPLPMRFAYPEPPRPGKPRQISSCPRVLRPGVACNLFFRKC